MLNRLRSAIGGGKSLLFLAVAGLLLGSSLGVAYGMGAYPSSTSWSEGILTMTSDEAADLKDAFDEQQATWGYVSQYGRTGRITSFNTDTDTFSVQTPKGVLTVTVGDNTHVYRAEDSSTEDVEDLTFNDLAVGTLIIVDGETGTQKGATAAKIEVIKEGDKGYNIRPADGDEGPRLVPLFP